MLLLTRKNHVISLVLGGGAVVVRSSRDLHLSATFTSRVVGGGGERVTGTKAAVIHALVTRYAASDSHEGLSPWKRFDPPTAIILRPPVWVSIGDDSTFYIISFAVTFSSA